ncbi:MAG: hypothetical protein ACRBFS_12395 [Aureispira sp.]
MKRLMQTPSLLIFLFASIFVLSSFSSVPVAEVRDDNPPVETTKESRRTSRLNKRYNRLSKRFDETNNTKQRYRLQKKIRAVERQQDSGPTPIWGIIGLVLGVLSFILFVAALTTWARAAAVGVSTGTAPATGGGLALAVGGLITAIGGVVISILSLIFNAKDPDKYILKGFGIAGIIVGSIFTVILAITLLIFIAASTI